VLASETELILNAYNRNTVTKDAHIGIAKITLDRVRRERSYQYTETIRDKHGAHAGQVELELSLESREVPFPVIPAAAASY
jgi:hypothetical protein